MIYVLSDSSLPPLIPLCLRDIAMVVSSVSLSEDLDSISLSSHTEGFKTMSTAFLLAAPHDWHSVLKTSSFVVSV